MRRLILILTACFVLAGCAHVREAPRKGCALTAYPLHVGDGRTAFAPTDFEAVLARAMTNPPRDSAERPSALILSGGSQHGAFGAGFFAGMKTIPDYKLVTGISTGALQSSFLFLANQPVPSDRRYPAYMEPGAAGTRSNAQDLALAYSIEKEGDLLHVGAHGELGGVVRGSIATFGPLRATLAGLLSRQTLEQIGRAYDPDPQAGRRLLVGVTDVNDGNGYAVDMTELAHRLVTGSQDFATVQGCYIDTLIASSSVPLAAPPVTLERRVAPDGAATNVHMYVDGGARFGVFWKQIGAALKDADDPDIALIVNGKLYGGPWTDKAGQEQTKWSSITLALRTVSILENQVYRFSVENIERLAASGARVKMAFISDENLGPPWGPPGDFMWQGKSCAQWMEDDRAAMKPVEFYPHYMRCTVAYGRARGEVEAWNLGK